MVISRALFAFRALCICWMCAVRFRRRRLCCVLVCLSRFILLLYRYTLSLSSSSSSSLMLLLCCILPLVARICMPMPMLLLLRFVVVAFFIIIYFFAYLFIFRVPYSYITMRAVSVCRCMGARVCLWCVVYILLPTYLPFRYAYQRNREPKLISDRQFFFHSFAILNIFAHCCVWIAFFSSFFILLFFSFKTEAVRFTWNRSVDCYFFPFNSFDFQSSICFLICHLNKMVFGLKERTKWILRRKRDCPVFFLFVFNQRWKLLTQE